MSQIILAPGINGTTVTLAADQAKEHLLARARTIESITNLDLRDQATRSAADIKGHLKQIEEDRVVVKAPLKQIGEEIDLKKKEHCLELEVELARLNAAIGAFEHERRLASQREEQARRIEAQRVEDARRKATEEAARAAQQETGAKALAAILEAEEAQQALEVKQAEIARAQHEAVIQADTEKARGGSLRQDWDIRVFSAPLLYQFYPQCVQLVPRLAAIKDLLKVGVTPPGVEATEKSTFATRAARPALR